MFKIEIQCQNEFKMTKTWLKRLKSSQISNGGKKKGEKYQWAKKYGSASSPAHHCLDVKTQEHLLKNNMQRSAQHYNVVQEWRDAPSKCNVVLQQMENGSAGMQASTAMLNS